MARKRAPRNPRFSGLRAVGIIEEQEAAKDTSGSVDRMLRFVGLPLADRTASRAVTKSLDRMSRRSKAREAVLQMLYQLDLNPDVPALTILDQLRERLKDEALREFAWKLFTGVVEHRAELDGKIEEIAANWSLKRMAPTDRNVLRLGAFELLHSQAPPRVAIDEAVELAKKYGSNQSAQFVNGILDRLMPGGRGAALRELPPESGPETGPEV